MAIDPIALATQLINCPSVTPARGAVFDVLEAALAPLGFACHRWVMGEPPDGPTENMVAIRGDGSPHFGFAGHLDVVPPGDGWRTDPFETVIEDGVLTGRGAVDMKSAIACFVAAALDYLAAHRGGPKGSISLLITGDEESVAVNGTVKLLKWAADRGESFDHCILGEPTNPSRCRTTESDDAQLCDDAGRPRRADRLRRVDEL